VAVEEDRRRLVPPLQEGQPRRQLVDEEDVGLEPVQLAVEGDGEDEVYLS
jgi:hypothetical protein